MYIDIRMYVCMYVYIYIYIYICMYVYLYMHMFSISLCIGAAPRWGAGCARPSPDGAPQHIYHIVSHRIVSYMAYRIVA